MNQNHDCWVVVICKWPEEWLKVATVAWTLDGTLCNSLGQASLILVNGDICFEQEHVSTTKAWLTAAVSARVWSHFGNVNSDRTTRKEVTESWTAFCTNLQFEEGHQVRHLGVNPFSRRSITPLKWDRELREFSDCVNRNGLDKDFNELRSWFAKLTNAWRAAMAYYDAAKPLADWADALFPLYLGIQAAWAGDEEVRHARWQAAKVDWVGHTQRLNILALLEFLDDTKRRATSATLKGRIDDVLKVACFLRDLAGHKDLPSAEEAEELLYLPELSYLLQQEYLA